MSTTALPQAAAELHPWLDAGLALAPEYVDAKTAHTGPGPAYASHWPMALHALSALGASAAELAAFDGHERQALPPRAAWPALDRDEAELRQRIAAEGAPSVLADCLPERMAHAGAAAFHGLIRTAHAWESGHAGELALALAWWRQRDQPLAPASASPPPELDWADWQSALGALRRPTPWPRAWIATRMQAWADDPGFQRWAPTLRLRGSTLKDLATAALTAYAASGDFTLLHAVTACRAMAVLGPCLDPAQVTPALRAFSQHWAAAALASGWHGGRDTWPEPPAPWAWPRLLALARTHPDAHAIKLTHAAWDWVHRGLNDGLCRQAATRALATRAA
ncbi:questin oxidase family protein [Inhella crocodyli]|uniref:DUF4243 domain-containing protein n=1 Tax=Inhella crocodyli TaxID=2499851 RepID=A0A437LL00_9BURK|nr:questin oxidase family protein [Inhella crocodyli]RVT86086.1 DUF4243 domain-containing protein [Inhella crocodyli]